MQCRFGLVWDALQETLHRLVEHAMQLQCTTTSSSGIIQIPAPSSSLLTHWRCYPHLFDHWNSKCCNISIKNNKSAPPAAPQTWASIKKWLNSNLSWLKSVKYFPPDTTQLIRVQHCVILLSTQAAALTHHLSDTVSRVLQCPGPSFRWIDHVKMPCPQEQCLHGFLNCESTSGRLLELCPKAMSTLLSRGESHRSRSLYSQFAANQSTMKRRAKWYMG